MLRKCIGLQVSKGAEGVENLQQWRDFLGKITKDPQERQRIANELSVRPITLMRWVSGESNPRPHNLRLLINALPEYRQVFLELIPEELGHDFMQGVEEASVSYEIPSIFYARVLNAHCTLPKILHFSSICDVILLQALKQLDPNRIGMEVTVVQCMPPSQGHKVRSLRESMGRGTPPWSRELEQKTMFLGIESLAGYVVSSGHSRAIQSRSEGEKFFPVEWVEWEESAMAYPIMRSDHVAGCFLVSCTQPNYFLSPSRQALIQSYAELLSVAFEPDAFYRLWDIELGRMLPYKGQQIYLSTFRSRVADIMTRFQLDLVQAERKVWQQIEEELLRASFDI